MESGAGALASFTDEAYAAAGAKIVDNAGEAWAADLVLKPNPPTVTEADFLGPGQVLSTRTFSSDLGSFVHVFLTIF